MTDKTLNGFQVAALLVSASYGIGFLFGSGEMALAHGMGGSIYGIATAIGMLILALFAKRLWAAGKPVWDLFGQAYGDGVKAAVALLSIVWMSGVLAAQIHGGLAVVQLLGVPTPAAYLLVLALIYGASRLDLRFASGVFSICLMASGLVLIYALIVSDGVEIYVRAVPRFATDLKTFDPAQLVSLTLAVVILVCTGADYHQFVIASRRGRSAVFGCVLAAACLLLVGFLPSAVVVAMSGSDALSNLADAKHVIPVTLARAAERFGYGVDKAMLVALSTAALGSGAAIVRAMTSALSCAASGTRMASHPALGIAVVAAGALLAARGQGIVETMVSVNVVYIASVGIPFAALLAGMVLSSAHAARTMASGFVVSFAVYVAGWAGLLTGSVDLLSLTLGLAASAGVMVAGFAGSALRRGG